MDSDFSSRDCMKVRRFTITPAAFAVTTSESAPAERSCSSASEMSACARARGGSRMTSTPSRLRNARNAAEYLVCQSSSWALRSRNVHFCAAIAQRGIIDPNDLRLVGAQWQQIDSGATRIDREQRACRQLRGHLL